MFHTFLLILFLPIYNFYTFRILKNSLTILIPDVENLAEVEEEMTEQDFKTMFVPRYKTAEDIKDDKIIMVNEVVNLTMPIIDSTYVNHHLKHSLLEVK